MPGSNAGTGHPYTFRCAKCRIGRDWQNPSDRAGMNWRITGALKGELPKIRPRVSRRCKAEYECLDCKHVGWSGHEMVLDAYQAKRLIPSE